MKKLSIILTAVLFASVISFAQNSALVNQTDNQNIATVDQTGTDNSAAVDQFGRNFAQVDQSGGNGNSAVVAQGTSGSYVFNYYQPAYNGDWQNGAFIEQIGSDNAASIIMTGSREYGSIYQEGSSNTGAQAIGTQHSEKSGQHSGIDMSQFGDFNAAAQSTYASFGSAGIKDMTVTQQGSFNTAFQASVGGYGAIMTITQIGNNNNSPAESGNAFDLSATGLTSPLALPWAHKPAGEFTQYANQMFGNSVMYVEGSNNNTAQYQEYTVWSLSGRNNADMTILGDGNDAAQGQLGQYNESSINISGSGNVVLSSQFGDSNVAEIDLLGTSDGNVAGIEQNGNAHNASILQNGAVNTATILQQ